MPYQNVYTPRIYLNIPEYLASTGAVIDPVFRTLPVSESAITTFHTDFGGVTLTNPYVAILGHSANVINLTTTETTTPIINGTITSTLAGFSIFDVDSMPTAITFTDTDEGEVADAGSILLGTYYDFPHSPDLKLSLSYSYEGIKETTTRGGATLTNQFYNKPPAWGSLGAWELGGEPKYAKSGRRVWDLSFSYLADSSVFPDNAGLANETADGNSTLLEADSFQRVIHLTNGGQIPFIFQSDGTASPPKPDQLAIAKFDMNSFKFDLVGNSVYNCKIKIREVW
jgi:hypothetical protein